MTRTQGRAERYGAIGSAPASRPRGIHPPIPRTHLPLYLGLTAAALIGLAPGGAQAGPCTASAPTWQNFPLSAQSGKFRVDFDAIPSGTTVNGVTTLSAAPGTTFQEHSILVRFSIEGKIDARNGGSYAASSPIYYQAGKSYHFRVEVDVPAHSYSVYVTPAGASEIAVGSNFAFRTEQNQVTKLANWGVWAGYNTNNQSHQSCNFQLSAAGTPAPTLALSANPTQVTSGGSSTLSWTSTNAQSCTASGGWTGTKGTSGSQGITNITTNTTYTLACTGSRSSVSKGVQVSVSAPSTPPTAGVCKDFYPAGFQLVSGFDNHQPSSLPKPVKGVPFADEWYRTCVVRATNHANEPPVGFARNDYSRRQPFNADNSKMLIYSYNGFWHLYDAKTLAYLKQLSGPGGDAEPQWHPSHPDLLYYLPTNGGLVVYELDVLTDQRRVVGDFTGRLPWPSAAHVWTKSEGSPSRDGRYWGFLVHDASWNSLGMFTWDLQTDTLLGTYSILPITDKPDNVSMSPTGQYLVASWDWDSRGTIAFSRDFSHSRQLQKRVEHADLALDANGEDAYVSVDYGGITDSGRVFMTNLRTGVRTDLFDTYVAGTTGALHLSGKAYQRPGWVLVSTYAPYLPAGTTRQWFHNKVFAVELKANPRIFHLAHTHNRDSGYWTEPQAAVNRDFTKILFNSTWEISSSTDIDAYMIELPSGAIPVN